MTIHRKIILAASLVCAFAAGSAQADSLISYGVVPAGTFSGATTASGITTSTLGAAGGALTVTGATGQRSFADTSGVWSTSEIQAGGAGSFVNLITYSSATSNATFDSLSLSLLRKTTVTDTFTYALVYRINAGTVIDPNLTNPTMAGSVNSATEVTFDLSGISDFDLVTAGTSVQFRLLVFASGTADADSAFIFANSTIGVVNTVNGAFNLEGTLSAIPEPSTYAMIGSILALGVAVCYRRKSS
jgi:hypothetical protein